MLKKIAVAALAGSALLAASGAAQARHGDGYRHYSHSYSGHRYYGHRYAPRVVYRPAPVYYPAPRYYTPSYYTPSYYAPSYYYEPRPVISGRIPIGHHGSIGFRLPL